VSTPAVQSRYITRQVQLLGQTTARGLFQPTFYDLDLTGVTLPPGSILPLDLGLADSAFNPKPALGVWDGVFAHPYHPESPVHWGDLGPSERLRARRS